MEMKSLASESSPGTLRLNQDQKVDDMAQNQPDRGQRGWLDQDSAPILRRHPIDLTLR